MSENVQVGSFYKYLISQGYYFDKDLIENFLLSLKVKPFLILTGNSGTGKTKLSQLFAKYLEKSPFYLVNATTKSSSWGKAKDGTDTTPGWTLSVEDFKNVLPLNEIEKTYEIEIGGYKTTGDICFTPQIYYERSYEDFLFYFKDLYELEQEQIKHEKDGEKHNDQKVKLGISCEALKNAVVNEYLQSSEISFEKKKISNTFKKGDRIGVTAAISDYIPLKGKVPCTITAGGFFAKGSFELKFKMANYMTDEIKEYLKSLPKDTKSVEIKIFGFKPNIDDFSPIWDALEYHRITDGDIYYSNYSIVPIGANWTDNTNIIGYHNIITNEHQSTPSYKLIKKAQEDLNNPYFLILDEMNLSHVERYFADFLSAIESGEEIPLYGQDKTLKLPNNLFIIGTVNVDETTYMFSPKVLDRANTIEFDTWLAQDYMLYNLESSDDDFKGNVGYLQSPLLDSDVSNMNIDQLKEILSEINCDYGNLWTTLAKELSYFQEDLRGSGCDFGFRVINEILRFMIVAWKYENSPKYWQNWERYFDAQIKQKILPKIHGSEKAVGKVLTKLFNHCLNEGYDNENPKNFEITEENCKYHHSASKIQNMAKLLFDQRYVSFIN